MKMPIFANPAREIIATWPQVMWQRVVELTETKMPICHTYAYWFGGNVYATKAKGKVSVFHTFSTSHRSKSTLVAICDENDQSAIFAAIRQAVTLG